MPLFSSLILETRNRVASHHLLFLVSANGEAIPLHNTFLVQETNIE